MDNLTDTFSDICKKKVTIWRKRGRHNHIEMGWVEANKPVPIHETRKGWLTDEWTKEHAWMRFKWNSTLMNYVRYIDGLNETR